MADKNADFSPTVGAKKKPQITQSVEYFYSNSYGSPKLPAHHSHEAQAG